MRVLGIIPARGGSKGVPGKNIKLLDGKPLIWYTIQSARCSKVFSEIILSTENQEIAEIAMGMGLSVPSLRPKELADDSSKSIDVVLHCLNEQLNRGLTYDAVILLQPTSPFREERLIENALRIFGDRNADSLVTVRKVPDHFNPHWVFESDEQKMLRISTGENEIISRRQDLPQSFYRDGQLYITSTEVILKNHSFFGQRLTYFDNEFEGAEINIDTMNDWYKAEEYILKNKIEY